MSAPEKPDVSVRASAEQLAYAKMSAACQSSVWPHILTAEMAALEEDLQTARAAAVQLLVAIQAEADRCCWLDTTVLKGMTALRDAFGIEPEVEATQP